MFVAHLTHLMMTTVNAAETPAPTLDSVIAKLQDTREGLQKAWGRLSLQMKELGLKGELPAAPEPPLPDFHVAHNTAFGRLLCEARALEEVLNDLNGDVSLLEGQYTRK